MSVSLHGISREAFDLIVESEVSSRAAYDKKYRRPERPGGQSGITVGIGYDCGYVTAATIRQDWGGKIPAAMVTALCAVAGLKGQAAQNVLATVRPKVDVRWDAAIDVFSNVSIPKYMAMARKGLPGFDALPPDCKGVLLSVVYNRGASFQQAGPRYAEMRGIRAAVISGDLALIPGLLREMKRLWTTPSVRGVALRREEEARLFERGLKGAAARMAEPEPEVDEPAPEPTVDPVVVDAEVKGDPELYSVQKRLKAMNYNPGVLDGRWGGGTSGALGGFINDRGGRIVVPASLDAFNDAREEIKAELGRAESESPPFTRPVSAARKAGDAATVAKVAPEVVPVKQNFWIALWGSIVTFFTAIWTQVKDYASQAWDWYTDNSDSGIISTATEYIGKVPTVVWLLAGGGALLWIAINSRSGVNKITQSVQSGERL